MRNQIALFHSRLSIFTYRVKSARAIITAALKEEPIGYVALSGGKDSTVVYALVREQCPFVPAVWSDDAWWLPETLEYIRRLQGAGLDVRQIRTNAHHADWFEVEGQYDGIPDYARRQGWGLCFLGLRQEESRARRLHLRKQGPLFKAQSDGFWHCNPIHNWGWRDVWAYILSNNLDYNHAYDHLQDLGIAPEKQRIGPLAVDRVLGYGQLTILKRGWPDLFNRFAAEFPEARNYV